ncbi:MAG: membrane protein insertase YidC, partial [Bacteroidia bacterium]
MDKKSLIGLGLIAGILGLWLWYNGPTEEQIARKKFIQDSITAVNVENEKKLAEELKKNDSIVKKDTATIIAQSDSLNTDSIKSNLISENYRDFAPALIGDPSLFTIENDQIIATINNKGGFISKVKLKNYKRYGQAEKLILFDQDSTNFSLKLSAYDRSRLFSTDSFYFKPVTHNKDNIVLRLSTAKEKSYIEFEYSLKPGEYLVNSKIRFVGMEQILTPTEDQLQLNWSMLMPTQEKNITKEREVSTVYYKQTVNDPDNISPFKDEELSINEADINWICFKQQFFNTSIIADNVFLKSGSTVKLGLRENSQTHVKYAATELGIPYNHNASETFSYKFYFGPNDYKTLKAMDNELVQIIPTGWSIFSYINKWLVIPIFYGLSNLNMGIVILILTLIIKIILLPVAYKTYLSGARMRVLKPELDAINAKFGEKADPMKKQQEQMNLYRKAGVSPLSGCLPLLLQFPILIALFSFIPAAIQLRQKSFLWAEDLSTYDSIWTF